MLSQNVICFLSFAVGQQVGAVLAKSEFAAMWIGVDSGNSVTSSKGKAVRNPGAEGYFPG